MKKEKQRMQDLVEEYKKSIEKELGASISSPKPTSKEYQDFKKEYMPKHLQLYKNLCNQSKKKIKNLKKRTNKYGSETYKKKHKAALKKLKDKKFAKSTAELPPHKKPAVKLTDDELHFQVIQDSFRGSAMGIRFPPTKEMQDRSAELRKEYAKRKLGDKYFPKTPKPKKDNFFIPVVDEDDAKEKDKDLKPIKYSKNFDGKLRLEVDYDYNFLDDEGEALESGE